MTRRRLILGLCLAVFAFLGFGAVRRVYTQKTDFDGFWRAGRNVLAGRDPYRDFAPAGEDRVLVPSWRRSADPAETETGRGFDSAVRRYLPFFPLLMVPFALLPMDVAVALWHLVSVAALLGSVRLAFRLSGRPRGLESSETIAVLVGTAIFWADSLTMGQIGLVTLYLSLAGIDFAGRGRPWLGGILVGLAAAIKVTPALVGAYFLLKRRWSAAAAMAGTGVLCALAVIPVWGVGRSVELHRTWLRESATTAGARYFELRESVRYQNQSLHAFAARFLMDVNAGRSRKPFRINVANLTPEAVAGVTHAAQALLGLALLVALFARRPDEPLRLSETAVVLGATTFLSPIAWTFHLVVMIPAIACLWDRRGERESRIWLGLALVFELGLASPWLRALGFLTWSCLAATVGAWRIAMKERSGPVTARPEPTPAPSATAQGAGTSI